MAVPTWAQAQGGPTTAMDDAWQFKLAYNGLRVWFAYSW